MMASGNMHELSRWLDLAGLNPAGLDLAGLQAAGLADWLFGSTLGAALIAIIAIVVGRYGQRPAIAHRLWLLAMIRLMLPPIFAFPMTLWAPSSQWSFTNASIAAPATTWHYWDVNLVAWFIATWILGSVLMSTWVYRSASRVRRLIEYRGRFDLEATKVLYQCWPGQLDRSPPKNFPEVWLVDAFVSPMLYCDTASRLSRSSKLSGKPIIVFPRALWNQMDRQSRIVLLKHELAHWSRHDQLVRWIEVIAMVFLWWHPLVWIARRQIESCEERCCDAAATLDSPGQRRVYAEAILQTLDFLCEPFEADRSEVQARPLGSGLSGLPIVEHRLYKIMRPKGVSGKQVFGSVATFTCCVAATAIAILPISPAVSIQVAPPASANVSTNRPLGVKSNVEMEILKRTAIQP